MEGIFSNKNILFIFTKWWKHLVVITVFGTVAIGAATYLIKPKYKSYAVVYPVNLGAYSEESYTEQMVAFLNSRDIANEVIKEFELDKHWGISPLDRTYQSKLFEYYYDFVSVRKTPYESVEISVVDIDPKLAFDMVNAILKHYNNKVRSTHRLKLDELINLNETHRSFFEKESNKTKEILDGYIRKSGDVEFAKTLDLERKYIDLSSNSKQAKSIDLERELDVAKVYGTSFYLHWNFYFEQIKLLKGYQLGVQQQVIERNKEITYYVLVSAPYVPDKKDSPKRVPITLIGGLSIFLLSFIILGFIEREKINS